MSELLRLALVGKTGNGKSSSGNSILCSSNVFKSLASTNGVTEQIQSENGTFDNKPFLLLDTPGIFDPIKSDQEITDELKKIIDILDPGPHVFLIVLKCGRFTREDELSVQALNDLFGPNIFKHSIILFTGIDNLQHDGTNFESYLNINPVPKMHEIINKCDGRYVGFNNRLSPSSAENRTQVKKLFQMIESLTGTNMANYYSGHIFQYTTQNTQRKCDSVMNNPNLNQDEKLKRITTITEDVGKFFKTLVTVVTTLRILISTLSMLCNIL